MSLNLSILLAEGVFCAIIRTRKVIQNQVARYLKILHVLKTKNFSKYLSIVATNML